MLFLLVRTFVTSTRSGKTSFVFCLAMLTLTDLRRCHWVAERQRSSCVLGLCPPFSLPGPRGEELFVGKISTGASDDLDKAVH